MLRRAEAAEGVAAWLACVSHAQPRLRLDRPAKRPPTGRPKPPPAHPRCRALPGLVDVILSGLWAVFSLGAGAGLAAANPCGLAWGGYTLYGAGVGQGRAWRAGSRERRGGLDKAGSATHT
jgi:hypothetical protein